MFLLAPTIAAEESAKTPAMPPRGTDATIPIPVSADPRLADENRVDKNPASA